ncbi:hypothetical protein MD484_g6324, partial [Candolleomyces efflorescens]
MPTNPPTTNQNLLQTLNLPIPPTSGQQRGIHQNYRPLAPKRQLTVPRPITANHPPDYTRKTGTTNFNQNYDPHQLDIQNATVPQKEKKNPQPPHTHPHPDEMSNSSKRITNYFAPLSNTTDYEDSDTGSECESPSPRPRPSLPPPQMLLREEPPKSPEPTHALTKRKGTPNDTANENHQPPRKQPHLESNEKNYEQTGVHGNGDSRENTPHPIVEGDVDMTSEERVGTLGGSTFDFTPPYTQTPPQMNEGNRARSPSLFSEISDTDELQPPDNNKDLPINSTKNSRTKKPLPPPKKSTINGHTVPASQLTPLPHKGFPPIHGVTTKSLTDAITTNTKKVWNTIQGPKAFVTVAYASPTKVFSLEHANDIKNTIRKFTNINQSMLLSPSELTSKTNNTTPQPFLLSGLLEIETKALCDFQVFSTPTLTLVIFPVRKEPDDYLMTLTGFLLEPTKENEGFVKNIVANTLEHDPTIIDWFNRNQEKLHPKLSLYPPVQIPKTVAKSTEVHALTVNESGGPQIVWGIYIFPPTLDTKLAMEFIALAKDIQYPSVHGYGNAKRTDFQCGLCRGRDHPTAVCPMKGVHGFFNNDPNPSHPNNAVEPAAAADKPQPTNTEDTLFDIPENRNQSRGHQTSRASQPTKGYGGNAKGRRGGRGLPK